MAARVLIPILIVLLVAQSIEAQQAANAGARPPSYGQAFLDGALIGDDYSRAGVGLAAGIDLPRRPAQVQSLPGSRWRGWESCASRAKRCLSRLRYTEPQQ